MPDEALAKSGELAQLARAPALHAGGQGFDSLILHHQIADYGMAIADFSIQNQKSEIRNRKSSLTYWKQEVSKID